MSKKYDYINIRNVNVNERFVFDLQYLENNEGIYQGDYLDLIEKIKDGSRRNIIRTKSWKVYKCYMISKHSLLKCGGKNKIFETLQHFKKVNG